MTGRPGTLRTIVAVGAALVLTATPVTGAVGTTGRTSSAADAAWRTAELAGSAGVAATTPVDPRTDDRAASRSSSRTVAVGVPPFRFPGFEASQRAVLMPARTSTPVPTTGGAGLVPHRSPLWVRTPWVTPPLPWS